jgi:hypothetical protein
MARPEMIGALNEYVVDRLTLWETVLVSIWAVCLLVRKLSAGLAIWAGQSFFRALGERHGGESESPEQSDLSETDSSGNTEFGRRVSDDEQLAESESLRRSSFSDDSGGDTSCGCMVPGLPDEFIRRVLWPNFLTVPLRTEDLVRFRVVSKSWHRFVCSTLEWQALEFVRIDTPGYLRATHLGLQPRATINSRLGFEFKCFLFLLSEPMDRFEVAGEIRVPSYVSLPGIPPSVDEAPSYYNV